MRRRQELMSPVASAPSQLRPHLHHHPLPPDRRFTVAELLQLQRPAIDISSSSSTSAPVPSLSPSTTAQSSSATPTGGKPRRRWLRDRLHRLVLEDMIPCPAAQGAVAPCLLELFERITGEVFAEAPGILLTARVRAISRVMANLAREHTFSPPLLQSSSRGYARWNRCPRVWTDWEEWRRRTQAAEEHHAPSLRLAPSLQQLEQGLAPWIRHHRYLQPTEVLEGECTMALLLLWEVDHERSFPSQGCSSHAGVLLRFTRKLQSQVQKDDELKDWLVSRSVQRPLAPGLPDTHTTHWSIRILKPPPSDPQGWWLEFTTRWRSYLASLLPSADSATTASVPSSSSSLLPVRESVGAPETVPSSHPPAPEQVSSSSSAVPTGARRRTRPASPGDARRTRPRVATDSTPTVAVPSPAPLTLTAEAITPQTTHARRRPRSTTPGSPGRPAKRQCDLRSWLRSPGTTSHSTSSSSQGAPHATAEDTARHTPGRATQGPPT